MHMKSERIMTKQLLWLHLTCQNKKRRKWTNVSALLARGVYTYEEFVIATEAPQCYRKTVTGQDTDNKE